MPGPHALGRQGQHLQHRGFFLPWAFHAVLKKELTIERFAARYGDLIKGRITRYEAENLHAFNFVCEGALGGGVSRSLYLDNYGKALSSALLDVMIAVPRDLLPQVQAQHLASAGLNAQGRKNQ